MGLYSPGQIWCFYWERKGNYCKMCAQGAGCVFHGHMQK